MAWILDDFDRAMGKHGRRLRKIIKEVIQEAYRVNQQRHDTSIGDRPMNFGINVWTTICKLLRDRLAEEMPNAAVTNDDNVMQVEIDGKFLRFAKLGHSETDELDPSKFFRSANKRDMAVENENEWRLFSSVNSDGSVETGPAKSPARYLLVGHFGNFKKGLRKISVGAVRLAVKGDDPWIWKVDVWSVDQDQIVLPEVPVEQLRPSTPRKPPPHLHLVMKPLEENRETADGDGDGDAS
ncbi:MAG: hypothetical protein KDC46_12485 [Thermoleophilia bacterium]|nr:hypothetical protein [Thermoleophilia bacterium]